MFAAVSAGISRIAAWPYAPYILCGMGDRLEDDLRVCTLQPRGTCAQAAADSARYPHVAMRGALEGTAATRDLQVYQAV